MTVVQNFQPMTRAKMAQLSLPDIRAYAKAYKVPANAIEYGTADELLDLIFELRPRYPKEYPINAPHLFTHKIARTQEDRDKDFLSHKPYSGFAYRENLASFRRAKSWISRPVTSEEEHQIGNTEGEDPEDPPAQPEDPPVMNQPVTSSSVTPTFEQPNPLAEDPQEKLSPLPTPSCPELPGTPNQDPPPVLVASLPSNDGSAPSQAEGGVIPSIPNPKGQGADEGGDDTPKTTLEQWRKKSRGNRPPPMPPALGFEVADDLSNLKSALEEHQETAAARPKPSRITVDDELFDLEFTPDMTRAGKEAIICERYAIAVSNHKMVEQMLAEAEAEAKQVLWQLTALQPQLSAAHEDMQRFIDEFYALTGQHNIIRQAIFDSEKMAKEAWELDWNEEWICTEDDEKEEDRMREITRARTAGVQLPSSPSPLIPHSPSRKRARDEGEGELEYADDEELQAKTQEPNPKRPRVESRETSTAPQGPSPKGRDKGKGRALVAEDSYTLPFPSSPFRMPPPPMPRFGPKDRCNIYPVYKPAVPGYEPPQSPEVEVRNQPEQYDGGHLPPSDEDNDTNDGPELDQGQANGDSAGEEQIGEDEGDNEVESTEERNESATQMPPGGAPSPAKVQPEGPQQGNPWQVLRYDRSVWRGYVVTDHTQMSPDLKRPVNWSIMGPQHPKSASYREWDDELEEQNPWHQGGRPILKQ